MSSGPHSPVVAQNLWSLMGNLFPFINLFLLHLLRLSAHPQKKTLQRGRRRRRYCFWRRRRLMCRQSRPDQTTACLPGHRTRSIITCDWGYQAQSIWQTLMLCGRRRRRRQIFRITNNGVNISLETISLPALYLALGNWGIIDVVVVVMPTEIPPPQLMSHP